MTLIINENEALNAEHFLYVDIREPVGKFAIFNLQFATENRGSLTISRDVVARDYEESGSSRERCKIAIGHRNLQILRPSGDHSAVAPPVPIPNTEVKRCSPDGSATIGCARVGRRQNKSPAAERSRGFCFEREAILAYRRRVYTEVLYVNQQ